MTTLTLKSSSALRKTQSHSSRLDRREQAKVQLHAIQKIILKNGFLEKNESLKGLMHKTV